MQCALFPGTKNPPVTPGLQSENKNPRVAPKTVFIISNLTWPCSVLTTSKEDTSAKEIHNGACDMKSTMAELDASTMSTVDVQALYKVGFNNGVLQQSAVLLSVAVTEQISWSGES